MMPPREGQADGAPREPLPCRTGLPTRRCSERSAPCWRVAQRWTAEALRAAAGQQRAARGLHRPPGQGPRRWGPILRVLGAQLDTLSGSRYVLTLRPAAVLVRGGDYEQTFERTAL